MKENIKMKVKVAINGLGRIGRCVAKIIADRDDVELVAVNASGTEEIIEYGLKYDSVHGIQTRCFRQTRICSYR